MDPFFEAVTGVLYHSWIILNESAPWVLLGFTVAAIVKVFVPDDMVKKYLGGNGFGGVFRAAMFGIPIPLCSCGVVPAAMGLKKQGASRGAVVSFLVSTPETGVDSIAITWALLDPIMTIFRPLTAFISAIFAGTLEILFGSGDKVDETLEPVGPVVTDGACCDSCGCSAPHIDVPVKKSFTVRLRESFEYSFGELLSDIGKWLFVGILLAGIVSYFIPGSFLKEHLGGGFLPMIIMLVAGIPIYICATSSTPLAAALVLKGLSPGAALVFLIAGPATNVTTMTLVYKLLGKRSLIAYLVAISLSALLCGYILDMIYIGLAIEMIPAIGDGGHELVGWFSYLCSVVLISLILWNIIVERVGLKHGHH